MIREIRRFVVKAEGGVPYTVVERGEFVTVAGAEVMSGAPTFATSTGWTVTPSDTKGEYWIERLRLSVHTITKTRRPRSKGAAASRS
jgi:hypothetical protein